MPNLEGTVNVPLLGGVPKKGVVIGVLGGGVIVAYFLYKRHQANAAATQGAATGYGYGATGYGTGAPGYYGYGYAYGAYGGGGFNPYPAGEAYGYGAYGYGMYNPYTGQYYGPGAYGYGGGSQAPAWWNTPPSWWKPPTTSGGGKQTGHTVTAPGNEDLNRIARANGVSEQLVEWLNPHLKRYVGTGKHIPKGTKVRV